MNRKFDFSEIDEALPAAEKMQEKDRMAGALENNYEAIRLLNANVEKLESRLSEALPKVDGAVSSLHRASTVSVSEESRQVLEQEGEKICQRWSTGWKASARSWPDASRRMNVCLSPQPLFGVWSR